MPMNIQQQDYNIMSQPYINKYMKLNIMGFDLNVVDEISGNLMSCDVSVDADSDLRRNCSVSLVVTDGSFDVASGNKIWLDKLIQPLVGYENIYTGEIQWYNQGIYLINAPTYSYDAVTNTLSFSGLDLMSKLTGLRNGALPGVPTIVPQGSNVRDAMVAAIKLAGFTKYIVEECQNVNGVIQDVPYDIQIEQGGYVFDIIKQLRDILPNYQVYFDVNGVFHYDQIPSGSGEPVVIDDNLWNNILVSETVTTDFEKVKNSIEIYGRNHSVSDYSSSTTVSGAQINLTIANYAESADRMIGFTLPSDVAGSISIKVNSLSIRPLVDSSGVVIRELAKDGYYVAVYQADNTYLFLGHQQAQAIIKDTNPESPFYVEGSVGEIREVLYGGDYDNIMSDELAQQRAQLELYWKCRLNDGITFSCVPVPWMDVNVLISHAPRQMGVQKQYMVKSFSASYGDVAEMSINAISYYPYYSDNGNGLPPGYTELSRIRSTGTQYIDTQIPETDDIAITCHFEIVASTGGYLFGAQQNERSSAYNAIYNHSRLEYNYKDIGFETSDTIDLTQYVLYGANEIRINGVGHHVLTGTGTGASVLIFGIRDKTGEVKPYGGTLELTKFQIARERGRIVFNGIPCESPLGQIGLYDTVSKRFFGNSGTDELYGHL